MMKLIILFFEFSYFGFDGQGIWENPHLPYKDIHTNNLVISWWLKFPKLAVYRNQVH